MIIATRTLKLRSPGKDIDIEIRVFRPELEDGAWSCRYEIDWPEDPWRHTAKGIDSIQAIIIAFQLIGSLVYASDYHKSGRLMLDGPGRGYGFPVPKSVRDLLEGDDVTFF